MAIIDKIQLSGTVYTIGNETTTAVTSASTDNEIPTAKAVYDAIPQGGGGKAIEAGTNISVTTGDTADTINCTLPMKAEVNNTSIYFGTDNWGNASGGRNLRIGFNSKALGEDAICLSTNSTTSGFSSSIVGGRNHYIYKENSFIGGGYMTNLYNMYEASVGGQYNNSVSASTTFGDSGNTLFSVGNGYGSPSVKHRHNAFEIRQNGDIYIADTNDTSTTNYYEKPMIKLQDALGGGGGGVTVDTSLDSGSTNAVANSAITNAINSKENHLTNYLETWTIYKNYSRGCNALYFTYRYNDNEVTGWFPFANINGKSVESENNFSLVETSAITTSISSSSTDAQVPSAKAVYDQLGGLKLVKLTQSEYDSLTTKDNSTLFVIVN